MGLDPLDYLQFILALAFVLGLIGVSSVLLRKFGPGGMVTSRLRPGQKRRLDVVESLALDPRRRVVIVRRDDVEHLLLLGPQGETVVEQGIIPPETPEQNDDNGNGPVNPMDSLAAMLPARFASRFQRPAPTARVERRAPSNDGSAP